ncbi:MAG: hypothetical protein U0271_32875 [Polyangiaceae bacterium]
MRRSLCGPWTLLAALTGVAAGCDTPSSTVDTTDLQGVFDGDAGTRSSNSAATPPTRRGQPSALVVQTSERPPTTDPGCVKERGQPDGEVLRVVGRPACRAAEVMEWTDPSGAPRYACLYKPPGEVRGELPLVVFFHGTGPELDDPSSFAKLTSLRSKQATANLTGNPERPGFLVLGIQGRAIAKSKWGTTFDTAYVASDNLDRIATDHFVDELVGRGMIDKRRIYALGFGRGGQMAATYAMLRADRVAAFVNFAPWSDPAEWTCPTPPPPGLVLYRACDAIAKCDQVESWLASRETLRAETLKLRLGDDVREEPNCAVSPQCTAKKGEANHHRWPKGREKDVLNFLGAHSLALQPD